MFSLGPRDEVQTELSSECRGYIAAIDARTDVRTPLPDFDFNEKVKCKDSTQHCIMGERHITGKSSSTPNITLRGTVLSSMLKKKSTSQVFLGIFRVGLFPSVRLFASASLSFVSRLRIGPTRKCAQRFVNLDVAHFAYSWCYEEHPLVDYLFNHSRPNCEVPCRKLCWITSETIEEWAFHVVQSNDYKLTYECLPFESYFVGSQSGCMEDIGPAGSQLGNRNDDVDPLTSQFDTEYDDGGESVIKSAG